MAGTHPYISGAGNVAHMIGHLRKSFPAAVSSETVKKLGLAPNNESYVINVLQFIGVIDSDGKKTTAAGKIFSTHKDEDFAEAFGELVEKAYSALFDLHGDQAWGLSNEDLITFFRRNDQTSEVIGRRQASTFKVLAGLAGHGELPSPRSASAKAGSRSDTKEARRTMRKPPASTKDAIREVTPRDVGLTVRVEINLPSDGTKETYDNIFKSIRENLLNG